MRVELGGARREPDLRRAARRPAPAARRATRCPGRRAARARPARPASADRATRTGPGTSAAGRGAGAAAPTCASVVRSSPSNRIEPGRRPVQRHDQPADRRLAAARLADEPERLASADAERDVGDRLHRAEVPLDRRRPPCTGNSFTRWSICEQHLALGRRPRRSPGRSTCSTDPDRLDAARRRGAETSTGWKQAKTCSEPASAGRGRAAAPRPGTARSRSGSAARSGRPSRPAERSGGMPGIEYSACERSWSRRGIERKSASEYGCRIAANSSSVPAPSTILPAYITITRLARGGDHAQVVRDQDHRHPQVAAQVVDQVEDLGLDRHVERGRRLVGDQQLRASRPAPSRSSPAGAGRRRAGAGSSRAARPAAACRPARAPRAPGSAPASA